MHFQKSYDVVAYTYKAETLCPFCTILALSPKVEGNAVAARSAEQTLDRLADKAGIIRADEHTFDSDDFPKVVFADALHHGESCDRCGDEL